MLVVYWDPKLKHFGIRTLAEEEHIQILMSSPIWGGKELTPDKRSLTSRSLGVICPDW